MIDIKTHKVVDLINSRELEYVINWLKTYPDIAFVCRDGSFTYKKAIEEALPYASHISDRFQLTMERTNFNLTFIQRTSLFLFLSVTYVISLNTLGRTFII